MALQDELELAINRFESYIKADPGNHMLWLELGDLQHRLSRFEHAMASYEKALLLSPGLPAARSRIASIHISQHRFPEAERGLRQLMEEGGNDPAILHNLGIAVYYQQRWKEARQWFEAADAAGVRAPSNYAYLARCLHRMGDLEGAIATCEQWSAAASDSASMGYLALLEMDNGNMARAAELAADVLKADPDNTDAALVVGTAAMEQQDAETAAKHFASVLDKEPDSGRAWLGLGLTRLYSQNPTEGIQALENAQKLMPDNSGTIVALGWARLSLQDAVGAEKAFREAIEADRGFAEAHGGLAVALLYQNRTEAAKEAMQVASRLDKNNFGGLYAKSILTKLQGKGEMATRMLANVLDQTPPGGSKPLFEYIRTFADKKRR